MYSLLNGKRISIRIGTKLAYALSMLDTGHLYLGMSTEMIIISTLIISSKAINSLPMNPNLKIGDVTNTDVNVANLVVHHLDARFNVNDYSIRTNVYVQNIKFLDYLENIKFDDIVNMKVKSSVHLNYLTNAFVYKLQSVVVVMTDLYIRSLMMNHSNLMININNIESSHTHSLMTIQDRLSMILNNLVSINATSTLNDGLSIKILLNICNQLINVRSTIKNDVHVNADMTYIDATSSNVFMNDTITTSVILVNSESDHIDFNCEITINQIATVYLSYNSSISSLSDYKLSVLDELTLEQIITKKI